MKRLFLRSTHRKWSRYHLLTLCSTISAERRRSSALRSDRPASSAKTAQQAHANKTYSFSPKTKHKKEIGRLICKVLCFQTNPTDTKVRIKEIGRMDVQTMGSYNRATFLTSVYPLHHMQVLKPDEVITHVSPSPAHFTLIHLFAPPTGCIDRLCPSFYFPPLLGLVALHMSGWAFLVREICSVGLFAWVFCCSFFHF